MNMRIGLDLFRGEPLLMILLLAFAILACLMIPLYFYVRKPKIGTTEWISRLDPVHFGPFKCSAFRGTDVIWSLLVGVCASFLNIVFLAFRYHIAQQENALQAMRSLFPYMLRVSIPTVIFAIGLYLLLRAMFDRTFSAMSLAILSGMMLRSETKANAFLVFSLLFLYFWASAPYDAKLFPRALWLLLSGICYGIALLPCVAMIWLLPFYVMVYAAVQAARYRNGNPETRKKKLIVSLVLIAAATIAGVFGLLAAYALARGWLLYSGPSLLVSGEFYRYMIDLVKTTLRSLLSNQGLRKGVIVSDAFGMLLGLAAFVPLLHGVIRMRDSRCLMVLCLLPFAALGFLVSGYYFLLLPMLLVVGWTWSTFRRRGHALYPAMFAGMTLLFFFAQNILI